MSADRLAGVFHGAGFDEGDAASRAALLIRARQAHVQDVGRGPEWMWFVPGRIEVFGKHTDYAGGRTLVAAAPRGFAVVASPRDDHDVRVRDPNLPGGGLLDGASASMRYVRAVTTRLATNFPASVLGTDITLLSDLPRAAGLSSSSALIVSVATALIRRASLETRDEWRAAIRSDPARP